MPYKLIAIDIDGTLLTTRRVVTPRTVKAISRAVDSGARVVLCTGRSLHSARSIAEQIHASVTLVFHSGSLILESLNGPLLRAINLPRNMALDIIAFLKKTGFDPLVYDPVPESRHFWYEPARQDNPWRNRYIEGSGERARVVPDLSDAPFENPAQIAVAGVIEDMDRLCTELERLWPNVGLIRSRSVLLSEYWFIEVVPPEVSKSAALAFLGTLYGIDRSEMISVGDNFNDMDMIAWTGLGVAVDNAPDEVKALADVIAPSNDDEGVACIIEKYLLD